MMTLYKKIVNVGLIAIIVGSIGWFLIHEYIDHSPSYPITQLEQIEEPGMNWIPLIPAISSVTVFFLRYFLIERKKKKKVKEISLVDHVLFETIEELINNEIPYMQFGTPGRTEVFKALVCEQLETFRDNLKEFIYENPEFESSTLYRKKLKQKIYEIVENCEHEWRSREIPEIVINKYNHFFRDRINLLLADITTSSLRYAGQPEEALEAFLNEVRMVFKLHLQTDALRALDNLNGELDGLIYNGKRL
jgi:hypothetical protein